MGLTDSKEGVGLSSQSEASPQVSLLLPDTTFRHRLQTALSEQALDVQVYSCEAALFRAHAPEEIDCLVLSTRGDESHGHGADQRIDGVRLLENLQASAQYIPTVMIVTDPGVAHAVRAMRALAIECFDQQTPLPLLARSIRDVALRMAAARNDGEAGGGI